MEQTETHQMTLVETRRIDDRLELTYVCDCGAATRRTLKDADFIQGEVAAPAKNGKRSAKEIPSR
jgi:hypothetical protein